MSKTWLQFDNVSFTQIHSVRGIVKPCPYTNERTKCIDILIQGGAQVTLWDETSTFKKFLKWWQELDEYSQHRLIGHTPF